MNLRDQLEAGALLVTVLTFVFGVYQYFRLQASKHIEQKIEARKPFLTIQLALYQKVTMVASTIANNERDNPVRVKAEREFYNLFWGKLVLVEDQTVEAEMVNFRTELDKTAEPEVLKQCSLALAVAIRKSLAISWNVGDWESHYTKKRGRSELSAPSP